MKKQKTLRAGFSYRHTKSGWSLVLNVGEFFMNSHSRTILFYFFVIIFSFSFHASGDSTPISTTNTNNQLASLIIIPCSKKELLEGSYKKLPLPKTSRTKLLFAVNIAPAEDNMIQATLVSTTLNTKPFLFQVNPNSTQTFTDSSVAKVLCKAVAALQENSVQIKTILFASESASVSSATPAQKNNTTPWLRLPENVLNANEYPGELPFTIPKFASLVRDLKNIYGKKFHTIALTQAPCSIECARELASAATYLITTNPLPLNQETNSLFPEKFATRSFGEIEATISEDMGIIPMFFEIISSWFSGKGESFVCEEMDESFSCYDSEDLATLTRSYMGTSYNVIECKRTTAIARKLKLLLHKIFGQSEEFNQKNKNSNPISPTSGLDQMTLKLTGALFFEAILNQASTIKNHHIDAGALCSMLSKAASDRIEAISPQNMPAVFRNIYMKNKHIIPLLMEIRQLAEEIRLLIMQATPNGTASLYIPFPDQIADDAFPESLLLQETGLDRLYLLLQIHLLIHEESIANAQT